MAIIRTLEELDALYDVPVPTSIIKEIDHLTPLHCEYVAASPFVLIASSGPDGLDCSPAATLPEFVRIVDERTLMLPIAGATGSTRFATSCLTRASRCSS
jgi:predicted pyridoxine 5'-phosphate oxidase superfamily flavin-nucleotide-binding protein